MVVQFHIIDSDCLTVSFIVMRHVIGLLIRVSPLFFRFQWFDCACEIDRSISQATVLMVYSGMDEPECNLCIKKIDKPYERIFVHGRQRVIRRFIRNSDPNVWRTEKQRIYLHKAIGIYCTKSCSDARSRTSGGRTGGIGGFSPPK